MQTAALVVLHFLAIQLSLAVKPDTSRESRKLRPNVGVTLDQPLLRWLNIEPT